MGLTGNEPISAANLKALASAGAVGGGCLLAKSAEGATKLTLSVDAEDYDRIEVDFDTYDINETGYRLRQTVSIDPGVNAQVGFPDNTRSYIRAAGWTITATCASSDGHEPHIYTVIGHRYVQ